MADAFNETLYIISILHGKNTATIYEIYKSILTHHCIARVIKIMCHKFHFVPYHKTLILQQDISCTSSVETFKYIRIISFMRSKSKPLGKN